MKATLQLLLACTMLSITSGVEAADTCAIKKLETTQLPDMNIPRAGHQLFYAGGELMVAGGHTDGFVPTPTAEYFSDGKWHLMQTTYPHDFGLSVVLHSGKVLLAGGCEQSLGIGQTYTAELYDPLTHTFRGFGNMCLKRTLASALELDSGKVVIAGNWYHDDGIELFSEDQSISGDNIKKRSFIYIKNVVTDRSVPYIFHTADNDALIVGSNSSRGDTLRCTFAERMNGDTVHIPLFETWHPLIVVSHHDETSLISDDYTYLMAVQDSTGQIAIARVCGTDISLLSTSSAVPMKGIDEQIEYYSNIIVDRQAGRAYLLGMGTNMRTALEKAHLYILSIDYTDALDKGASLTLYYTDPLGFTPDCSPLLTPEGNLVIAGGFNNCSNFTPSSSVYLLKLGSEPEIASMNMAWWLWVVLAIVALVAITLFYHVWHRRSVKSPDVILPQEQTPTLQSSNSELMERINNLMEQQRLYLNPDLNLAYIANELGFNRNYVSDCINSQTGGSFTTYVTNYRINHAKSLLRNKPDIKISDVWMSCGFTNEASFFRTFKSVTGMTPKEWISQI